MKLGLHLLFPYAYGIHRVWDIYICTCHFFYNGIILTFGNNVLKVDWQDSFQKYKVVDLSIIINKKDHL